MPRPRRAKPGDRITAAMWNELVDFVLSLQVSVGSGSGLEFTASPFGRMLTAVFPEVFSYAQLTTNLSAAVGGTLGTGTITLCSQNGATLTADGATGLTCYNSGGAVSSGAFLLAAKVNGQWAAVVAPCT